MPIQKNLETSEANDVAVGIADEMGKIAGLGPYEIVSICEVAISLKCRADVLRFVERERIRSVIVVSPQFRSRRAALVDGATLGRPGIMIRATRFKEHGA